MITKTKTALIAAFVLGSASAALAQDFPTSTYLRNPSAPVPQYQNQVRQPSNLIEGRNVAVQQQQLQQVNPERALADRSINLAF
ncbi:MAG: hypothetical protein WD207_11655 [Xanthobacteraceae bacterium]